MTQLAPATRWQHGPAWLAIAGALAVAVGTWLGRAELGHGQWPLWIGSAAALAGGLWFRRTLTNAETDALALAERIRERERALVEREVQWQGARKDIEGQLSQQAKQVTAREAALSAKLITFHEWMEFPQPLDLTVNHDAEPTDAQLTELARKDRQLESLLQEETKGVFEDILQNKYVVDGKLQPLIIRDDVVSLMRRVAKIYQPEVEDPMLETSISQVLRAASRACLQLLVVTDQLPWNVKEQSFNNLYGYVRQGVKAYGMYKSVEPYWGYVNSAYMLGRFALGANPLTLAAWWFLGAWGQDSAKKFATQVLQRQAMFMVQSVIRVIGYEVAGTYGGDFRHRDANWIYGVELAELVFRFPLSRESLSHALKEIGALQLRHEYDRVYLYRCLAAHVSPDPGRYRSGTLMAAEEKMAIARRLERFLETFIHGQTPERVTAWRGEVEGRLGVKLNVASKADPLSVEQQTTEAIRSLASFALAIKEREPEALPELLGYSQLFHDLPPDLRSQTLVTLMDNPPYFFEHPTLDGNSPVATRYLQDLAVLAAKTAPHEAIIDEMLVDVAVYLRQDARRMRRLLDKQYVQWLADQLPADAPERRFAPEVARAVLDVIGPREQLQFVYGNVAFDWPEGTHAPSFPKQNTWLVGVADRLIVFSLAERPMLLWRADGEVIAERVRGYLAGDLRLRGGQWVGDVRREQPWLRIGGPLMSRHESYFKPLLARCTALATNS
jgi:hypothetical protein